MSTLLIRSRAVARVPALTRTLAYVMPTFEKSGKEKVVILGSGSFGTAMSGIIGNNAKKYGFVEEQVNIYCFDEEITVGDGIITFPITEKLTKILNKKHENVKYLPGVKIPENVVACPDVLSACLDATLLIFVMPFQYLQPMLPTIRKIMHPNARGVSLIKEISFDKETLGVRLISQQIQDGLSTKDKRFQCGVLMGANVASEIAHGDFSESTLASRFSPSEDGDDLNEKSRLILNNPDSFRVYHIEDVAGCEASGALKNIVAIGAGMVDGLEMGGNTKAALMRIGIQEMERFCNEFLDGIDPATFSESCGMADLITTCVGGRNRKCGEIFARHRLRGESVSWDDIERDHLQGQRLRGVKTARQVNDLLESKGLLKRYPLFSCIYEIAYNGREVSSIIDGLYIPNEITHEVSRREEEEKREEE